MTVFHMSIQMYFGVTGVGRMHVSSCCWMSAYSYVKNVTDLGRGIMDVRGGADKSLVRPTSRCRRTESIVSLERGVCSCVELQVFSGYRSWKEAYQATRAISTTSRCELSNFFFPARQGAEGNSRHSDRNIRGTCTKVCHHQKQGGPRLNVVIFPPVMRLVLCDPKQWPPQRLLIKCTI